MTSKIVYDGGEFVIEADPRGARVVKSLGMVEYNGTEKRLFAKAPLVESELVYEESRLEAIGEEILEKPLSKDKFEELEKWYSETLL